MGGAVSVVNDSALAGHGCRLVSAAVEPGLISRVVMPGEAI